MAGIDVNILGVATRRRYRHCRRFRGCHSRQSKIDAVVKALALLATFIRYRGMENEGDKTGRWMAGKRDASASPFGEWS